MKTSPAQRLALLPLIILLTVIISAMAALAAQLDAHFWRQILGERELHFALAMSLATSLIALLIAMLIAIPGAWALSQRRYPLQKLLDTLFDLPMVLPPLVTGLSLLLFMNSQHGLGRLVPVISQWIFSPVGIVIAQSYIASAIMLRSARGAFATLDPGYRLTAYNLGLPPLATLLRVELPLCWKPLLAGAILAWSRAIGEFGATLMLAGATRFKTETLPMAVYLNIASGDFELAIGAALWLLAISAALLLLLRLLQRED